MAILVGLSLGLIGGGGSILTIPILIYFFKIEPILATAYSLFVVGITSAAGSVTHYKNQNINLKVTVIFGLPSLLTVFFMRWLIMPSIPVYILNIGSWELTKPILIMLVFAILMVLVGISMIRETHHPLKLSPINYLQLVFQGVIVGAVTGFVGVGGGFLIIPALVLFAGMSMKKAVGTSLAIMTLSSLLGVTGDILQSTPLNYSFLAMFSLFAVAGIIAGGILSKSIDDTKLKPAFGWLVLTIGMLILITEIV